MKKKLKTISFLILLVLMTPMYRCTTAVISEVTAAPWQPDHDSLAYIKEGNGPDAVLFLHGLAGSSAYFGHRWGPVPKSMTFYATDLLGFGDSPKPKGSYDLAMHAKSVQTFIDQVILPTHPRSIQLVAHSTGTLIALELLKNSPNTFAKTLIIAAPLYKSKQSAAKMIGAAGMMYQGMAEDNLLIAASCFFRDSYRIPILAKLFDLPKDVYLAATKHSWNSLHGTLHNTIMNFSEAEHLTVNGAKIIFFHAVDDDIAPIENARAFAERIGGKFIELDRGGHQVFLERPQYFLDFLAP